MSVVPLVRLGDCCEIVSGATPKTGIADYWGGEIAWATPKDLSNIASKYLATTPQTLTEEGYRSCSAKIMPAGSVLFSSRAPIGHVAINKVPMCTNQGFKSFVPDPERVSPDYLYHWLKANKAYLQSLGNGATFKEVSKATVEEVKVPLPALTEQRRIAAILDKADALRAKRREAIAKLDQLLQSVFLDMFGDPQTNSKNWPLLNLTDAAYFQEGPGILAKDFRDDGVPLIRMAGLRGGRVTLKGCNYVDPEMHARRWAHFSLIEGDILVLTSASFGNPCVVDTDAAGAIFYTGIIRFRSKKASLLPDFLKRFLASPWFMRQATTLATGATIKHFGPTHLKRMQIPLPSVSVQQKFADVAAKIELERKEMQNSAEMQSAVFSSLQHRAFTGSL